MFQGFPADGLRFLKELEENNDKVWFEANKERFKRELQGPAVDFVEVVGQRLQAVNPAIRYDLRTNGGGSLMRIYRDTRFSKDKTPYKTAVAGMWWEGEGKKTTAPAFGFQILHNGIGLVAGMFGFDKHQLQAYREGVADDEKGADLERIITEIELDGDYEVLREHYKKVPRGYPADHPRERLLRFNALYVHPKQGIGAGLVQSPELVDVCMAHFEKMAPLQQWLVKTFRE